MTNKFKKIIVYFANWSLVCRIDLIPLCVVYAQRAVALVVVELPWLHLGTISGRWFWPTSPLTLPPRWVFIFKSNVLFYPGVECNKMASIAAKKKMAHLSQYLMNKAYPRHVAFRLFGLVWFG